MGFLHIAFIVLRYIFIEFLSKICMNHVKWFFCIYWVGYMIFILQVVNVVDHTDWFRDTESSFYPWNRFHLITQYDTFIVLFYLVCQYFVGLEKVSFPSNPIERQCQRMLKLPHNCTHLTRTSKVMLKILQARLQQYVNHELSDVQAGFRKGRGTRD